MFTWLLDFEVYKEIVYVIAAVAPKSIASNQVPQVSYVLLSFRISTAPAFLSMFSLQNEKDFDVRYPHPHPRWASTLIRSNNNDAENNLKGFEFKKTAMECQNFFGQNG